MRLGSIGRRIGAVLNLGLAEETGSVDVSRLDEKRWGRVRWETYDGWCDIVKM